MLINQQLTLRLLASLTLIFTALTSSVVLSQVSVVQVERIYPTINDVSGSKDLYVTNWATDDCDDFLNLTNFDVVSFFGICDTGPDIHGNSGEYILIPTLAKVTPTAAVPIADEIATDIVSGGSLLATINQNFANFVDGHLDTAHNIDTSFRVGCRTLDDKDDEVYTRRITITLHGNHPDLFFHSNYEGGISVNIGSRSGIAKSHSASAIFNSMTGDWDINASYTEGSEERPCALVPLQTDPVRHFGGGFTEVLVFEDVVRKGDEFDINVIQWGDHSIAPEESIFEFSSTTVSCDVEITDQFTSIPGDIDDDCNVTFLDLAPFIALLAPGSSYDAAADLNCDDAVTFLDIYPFIQLLASQ